jgi:hypothetical protein
MNLGDLQRRVLAIGSPKLLLDKFPNAAAAYSLRLLRTAYTGNCIEVRRSSDNALQNIGFVNGVLDTASLLSFVGVGIGFVRTWYDQSGNGANLIYTGTGTGNLPAIVNNGVVVKTPENNNAIDFRFDNNNRFLPISDGSIFRNKNYGLVILAYQNSNLIGRRDVFAMHINNTGTARFVISDGFTINNRERVTGRRIDDTTFNGLDANSNYTTADRVITGVRNWGDGTSLLKRNSQIVGSLSGLSAGFTSDTNSFTNTNAASNASGMGNAFGQNSVNFIFEAVIYNDSVIDSSIIGIEQNILTYYNIL